MLALEQEVTTPTPSQEEKVTFLRCTVIQKEFAAALKSVANGVSKRSTLPILANVLINVQDGRITLQTTNLESGYTTSITGEVTQEGRVTVSYQWLNDAVKTIAKTAQIALIATCIMTEDGKTWAHKVTITSQGRTQQTDGIDAEEFPRIPALDVQSLPSVTLNQKVLQQIVNEVGFVAATDGSRPVFMGMHFLVERGKLFIAACDAFRLSYRAVSVDAPETFGGLFPAYALIPAIKSLPKTSVVTLASDQQRCQAVVIAGETTIVMRLIEGTYPNYRAIVPKEYVTRLTVDRLELLNVLEAAKPVSKDNANIVKLSIEDGVLKVNAENDAGGKFEDTLLVSQQGPDQARILLNIVYPLGILKATTQQSIWLDLLSEYRPGVIRPVDDDQDARYTYVVMPMSPNR